MIFFTSDLHFDHTNIIKICNRPFKDVDDMNNSIISNWNKTVGKDDTVYILGDITMGKSKNKIDGFLNKLNGTKIIIKGNHDKENVADYSYLEKSFVVNNINYNFIMFHYPIECWNGRFKNSIHLHGHTHDKEKSTVKNRYNVCVEANNYTPVSIDSIVEYFNKM
jgi:calcineurin-like phosphoesterase family protein